MTILAFFQSRLARPANGAVDIASLVGPAAWRKLSPAIRKRFAHAHESALYSGSLDLGCSAIGACFALCGRVLGGPLVAARSAHAGGRKSAIHRMLCRSATPSATAAMRQPGSATATASVSAGSA